MSANNNVKTGGLARLQKDNYCLIALNISYFQLFSAFLYQMLIFFEGAGNLNQDPEADDKDRRRTHNLYRRC